MTWAQQAQVALDKLGGTFDEAVAVLRAEHITGKRRDSDLCPIANWLTACGVNNVAVGVAVAAYVGEPYEPARVDLAPHIAALVIAFDHGLLPDLEA